MITLGGILVLNLAIVLWLYRRARARTALRICREFSEAFPGRCMICSMHRVALENGYGGFQIDQGTAPHICPEGNSEPVPASVPRAIVHR